MKQLAYYIKSINVVLKVFQDWKLEVGEMKQLAYYIKSINVVLKVFQDWILKVGK